jgi:hypothetical protein
MPEAANAKHRDDLAGSHARVPQSVERGYSRAHQRPGIHCADLIRYQCQRNCRRHHVLRVAAVTGDARDRTIYQTQIEVPAAAGIAISTVPAEPTYADAVADLPAFHAVAQRIHHARDFVPGNARILNTGKQSLLREHIAVTDAAGLHLQAHIAPAGLRNFAFDDFKRPVGFGNLHYAHLCHDSSVRISVTTALVLSQSVPSMRHRYATVPNILAVRQGAR